MISGLVIGLGFVNTILAEVKTDAFLDRLTTWSRAQHGDSVWIISSLPRSATTARLGYSTNRVTVILVRLPTCLAPAATTTLRAAQSMPWS